jgi:hypothetical protein
MLDLRQAKYLEKQFNDSQNQLRDIVCAYIYSSVSLSLMNIQSQFHHAPKQP